MLFLFFEINSFMKFDFSTRFVWYTLSCHPMSNHVFIVQHREHIVQYIRGSIRSYFLRKNFKHVLLNGTSEGSQFKGIFDILYIYFSCINQIILYQAVCSIQPHYNTTHEVCILYLDYKITDKCYTLSI